MILDGKTIKDRDTLDYDVCIAGSGPAGITLAMELKKTKKHICLLEAGNRKESKQARDDFYSGDNVGIPYRIAKSRSRRFGGTSDRWRGYLAVLDRLDFEKNPWIPRSGWPISYDDLDPYYRRAYKFLGLSPFEFDAKKWARKDFEPVEFASEEITSKIWHFEETRFAKAFGKSLDRSSSVDVYLNAALTEIHLDEASDRVAQVKVNVSKDRFFHVRAKHYVLACGAIENARILLAQNERTGADFANDNIGRYFQEHPHFHDSLHMVMLGKAATSRLYKRKPMEGEKIRLCAFYQISEALRKKHKLANSAFRAALTSKTVEFYPRVLKILKGLYTGGDLQYRLSPLVMMSEQMPNPASRITLSKTRDPYGMPRVRLDWRIPRSERKKIYQSMRLLGVKFGQNGLGRLRIDERIAKGELEDPPGIGYHHMGTTRMAESAKDGVVDENCRVFGLDNLFIAGSSVFPTSGCANPTFTLMALAVRLADHLKKKL